MGKKGKRKFVRMLRLLETFPLNDVTATVDDAIARGLVGFGAALGLEPQLLLEASAQIVMDLPMTLRRRSIEAKLVIEGRGDRAAEPDQTMVRAIARARRSMSVVVTGVHSNVVQLAEAYRTDAR